MPYQYSTFHAITSPVTLARRLCYQPIIELLGEDTILGYAKKGLPENRKQRLLEKYDEVKERVSEMAKSSFFSSSYVRFYEHWFLAPQYSTRPLSLVIPQMSAYEDYNALGKVDHDALSSLRGDVPMIKKELEKARERFIVQKRRDVPDLQKRAQVVVLDGLFLPFVVHPDSYEKGIPTTEAVPMGMRGIYVPHSVHDSAYDPEAAMQRKILMLGRKEERFGLDSEEQEILERAKIDPAGLREEFSLLNRINYGFRRAQMKRFFENYNGTVVLLGYRKILETFGLMDGEVPDNEVFRENNVRLALTEPGSRNQVYNHMMRGMVSGSGKNALGKHLRNYMEDLYEIYPVRA